MNYINITEYAWMLLGLFFALVSIRSKRKKNAYQEKSTSQYPYLLLLICSFVFIYSEYLHTSFLGYQVFKPRIFIGIFLNFIGIAFSIWARIHLGDFWSGRVIIMNNHRLITDGPYRISRHPIYTGLLVAQAGALLVQAEIRSLVGFILLLVAIEFRVFFEERLLKKKFGPIYYDYSEETKKIIPFLY